MIPSWFLQLITQFFELLSFGLLPVCLIAFLYSIATGQIVFRVKALPSPFQIGKDNPYFKRHEKPRWLNELNIEEASEGKEVKEEPQQKSEEEAETDVAKKTTETVEKGKDVDDEEWTGTLWDLYRLEERERKKTERAEREKLKPPAHPPRQPSPSKKLMESSKGYPKTEKPEPPFKVVKRKVKAVIAKDSEHDYYGIPIKLKQGTEIEILLEGTEAEMLEEKKEPSVEEKKKKMKALEKDALLGEIGGAS